MAEPIALLDVNVLIALIDPQHVHYEPCHHWFQAHGGHGWATCSLTQNALLRILGNPRYSNSSGGPDALSSDAAGVFVAEALLHHGQITDA
jgi:predicted nucleic acid-binding protein